MARTPKHVHVHDEEDADGCLCDIDVKKSEETKDIDLPAAFGGVEVANAMADDDESDGCDVDFAKGGAGTSDAELPEARGGVE